MFKLLRDSIFSPKKIIYYRAKKGWFVFLYMLMLSLLMGLAYLIEIGNYSGLSYLDKKEMIKSFEGNSAYIDSGVLVTEKAFEIDIDGLLVVLVNNKDELKNLKSNPTLMVLDDSIYFLSLIQRGEYRVHELSKITALSKYFNSVDFDLLTTDSDFFIGIDEVINKYLGSVKILFFLIGTLSGFVYMLGFALVTYLFLNIAYKTNRYMKKGQLFKMLIFVSTAVILGETFVRLMHFNALIGMIILFISFIPLYVLEKEFIQRMRMRDLGNGVLNDQNVVNKINELLNKKNEDTNKSDDEDDYDSDEDDD